VPYVDLTTYDGDKVAVQQTAKVRYTWASGLPDSSTNHIEMPLGDIERKKQTGKDSSIRAIVTPYSYR
jgi:hypothetical protein